MFYFIDNFTAKQAKTDTPNKAPEKKAAGGNIAQPVIVPKLTPKQEEKIIEGRWEKKRASLSNLSDNIIKLRRSINKDLQDEDEKVFLTALVIYIMDKTGERVGNEESMDNGHYGVTGFCKEHISFDGTKTTFTYIGKSGVEQTKSISDDTLVQALKRAMKISPTKCIFETSDGFKIKNDRINRYLDTYNVSAKDLRGYFANKIVYERLKKLEPVEGENEEQRMKKRTKALNEIARYASKKVGHGVPTLKKHYLLPELMEQYISKGKVIEIDSV